LKVKIESEKASKFILNKISSMNVVSQLVFTKVGRNHLYGIVLNDVTALRRMGYQGFCDDRLKPKYEEFYVTMGEGGVKNCVTSFMYDL